MRRRVIKDVTTGLFLKAVGGWSEDAMKTPHNAVWVEVIGDAAMYSTSPVVDSAINERVSLLRKAQPENIYVVEVYEQRSSWVRVP